jgi:hypothetical protein
LAPLDALEGRPGPDPTGRRRWILVAAGAAGAAAVAGLLATHTWTPRSAVTGQPADGCYLVYGPDAQLLDAGNAVVGEATVGSHFVSQATTNHPYQHRRYGHVVETGQRGWISEAKIRRAAGTCRD